MAGNIRQPIKMTKKYMAMVPVIQEGNNVNFSSIYAPEIFFDEWSPCVTCSWSRIYNEKTRSLQPDWSHINSSTTTYFTFKIPEKAIHGLLFLDNGSVYFRDHYKGRLSSLRIRNTLKGMNILGAFWVPHQQRLIIHDLYMQNSISICEEVYTERWNKLETTLASVENDEHFQGFSLQIAEAVNENAGDFIGSVGTINEEGDTFGMILQPNVGLAFVIHSIPVNVLNVFGHSVKSANANATANANANANGIFTGNPGKTETEAYITKHSKFNGPESFQLWDIRDESDLGMPCIQNLKLIQSVRAKLKEINKFAVKVKWNKNLNSYEVTEINECAI
jgi:hypothetical protein